MRRRLSGMQPLAYIATAKGGLAALGLYLAWAQPRSTRTTRARRASGASPRSRTRTGGVIMMAECRHARDRDGLPVRVHACSLGGGGAPARAPRGPRPARKCPMCSEPGLDLAPASLAQPARPLEQLAVRHMARAGDGHRAAHGHVAAECDVAVHVSRSQPASDGGPPAKRSSKPASSLKWSESSSTCGAARRGRGELERPVVGERVRVRAHHQQVVGLLHRNEARPRAVDGAGALEQPDRGAHRGLELITSARPGRSGRPSCGSRSSAARAPRLAPQAPARARAGSPRCCCS